MGSLHYSGSDIRHASLFSYSTIDNMLDYYTTVEDNEVIDFEEKFKGVHANFIWIESIDSPLKVTFNNSEYIVYIPAGHAREISYLDVVKMKIHCPVGTKLRWYIQTF
jgi:hypothetical protein